MLFTRRRLVCRLQLFCGKVRTQQTVNDFWPAPVSGLLPCNHAGAAGLALERAGTRLVSFMETRERSLFIWTLFCPKTLRCTASQKLLRVFLRIVTLVLLAKRIRLACGCFPLYWNFTGFTCGRQIPYDSPYKQISSRLPGYPTECREYNGDMGMWRVHYAHRLTLSSRERV